MTLKIKAAGVLRYVQKELLGWFGLITKINYMGQNFQSHIRFITWDLCLGMNVHNLDVNVNSTKLVWKL